MITIHKVTELSRHIPILTSEHINSIEEGNYVVFENTTNGQVRKCLKRACEVMEKDPKRYKIIKHNPEGKSFPSNEIPEKSLAIILKADLLREVLTDRYLRESVSDNHDPDESDDENDDDENDDDDENHDYEDDYDDEYYGDEYDD